MIASAVRKEPQLLEHCKAPRKRVSVRRVLVAQPFQF